MSSEITSRHKKEIKALEGEKRAALKKAKGTKGKKAKEAIAALDKEYEQKLKDLQVKHKKELEDATADDESPPQAASAEDDAAATTTPDDGMTEKERKQAKAREKKLRKKQREAERQAQIEEETANAGPGLKQIEEQQIQAILSPLGMEIVDVTADGHCLYRAVGAQTQQSYSDIRNICADVLSTNHDEFAPFCEFTDAIPDFDRYIETVRNTAEWGGHLELRALGMGLKRTIEVYSVQSGSKPLIIEPPPSDGAPANNDPIRLSYHMHYYALGEHYNQIVQSK